MAQIITFGTMAARGSIRDVGRAMAMPYAAVDAVAKLVPRELNITLDSALKKSAELRNEYETDLQIRDLIDMARKVEGMPRNASTHAAGSGHYGQARAANMCLWLKMERRWSPSIP